MKWTFMAVAVMVIVLVQDLVITCAFPFDLESKFEVTTKAEPTSLAQVEHEQKAQVQEVVAKLEPISSTVIPVANVYSFDRSVNATRTQPRSFENSVSGARSIYGLSGAFFDMSSRPKTRVRLITKYSYLHDNANDADKVGDGEN